MTSTRRRVAPLIAFGVAIGLSACGGDRLVLPEEGRPAKITIVSGDAQSAAAGGVLGEALVVRVTDAQNRPVEDQAVAFTIDAGGGQVAPASVQTGTDGQASSSWTLGGAAGAQRVQATVDDDNLPATLLVMFNASAVSGVGAVLALESGDNQTAAVGSALPDSLVVRVTDLLGNPAAGVPVDWSVDGGGSISPATVLTGADGKAAAERVLGNTAGPQTAQAASGALTPVSFAHTAGAANPTVLVLESGNGQTGPVGAELADSLVVRLMDDNGNGVGGKPITWVVGTGGGAVNPSTATTNPNGFAKTAWTLGPNVGSNLVNAVFSGLPSVPFTATGGAGVATKLAFIQPPLTTSAGATITPAVRVAIQDAAGNTVTAASNTVTVALGDNPGGAVLSGTLTVSAVNGVASFPNLSIDKTGNGYTLTAVADGLDGTTSPAFDILTGNANRLVFIVEPTDRTVGQQFSPSIQVQVQDVGGNPVLTASNSITLTSSVTGTLSGNAVATPILGTATFSNLAINKAGNDYTLTAFSSGVTSRTSVDFDVAQAGTTVAITGDNPDPSVPGQNVTVAYDVNISAPGAGGLTGTVTVGVVGDGAVSCTGSISAGLGTGACTLAFPSAGTQDLVATYSGDANFVGSASPAVQHVVNQANTTIAIQPESPATSVVGEAVTVQWNLTSPGSVPLTGTVTLTVGGGAETCSSPAALGSGSCALTFTSSGSRPITATYSGDANYNGSSDGEPHTVIPGNAPPTAVDDPSYTVAEDATLNVNPSNDVLDNDTDDGGPQPLTAINASDPANGSVVLNANGTFSYTPDPEFNGTDSFTYQASDGSLTSNTATVTITVSAVNDAPAFTSGGDVTASLAAGAYAQLWATGASAGPPNEGAQSLSYEVSIDPANLVYFSIPPAIASDGRLTFTPAGTTPAPVSVTVVLRDNGGTANGGVDASTAQIFGITIGP